jgi:hypothetical protein
MLPVASIARMLDALDMNVSLLQMCSVAQDRREVGGVQACIGSLRRERGSMKMARHGVLMDAAIDGVFAVLVDTPTVNTCPTFVLAVTWQSATPCAASPMTLSA